MCFLALSGHLILVRTQQRSCVLPPPSFPGHTHIHTSTHETGMGLSSVLTAQEACPYLRLLLSDASSGQGSWLGFHP